MSDITNATLNITLNTYSLQDALTPNGPDATGYTSGYIAPYLFHTGCQYNGVQNCTAACQEPESAFSTLDTLHNCMMYPIIADQYAKNNLSSDITQLAQSLGIEKAQWPSTVSLNITTTIGTCLDAYCASLPECSSELQSYNESAYAYEGTFKNFTGSFYFDTDYYSTGTEFDLCAYYSASLNQDIGGIGVGHILNMKQSFADSRVGICILLDPDRHRSISILDGRLVEMGGILFESRYLCPVSKSQ